MAQSIRKRLQNSAASEAHYGLMKNPECAQAQAAAKKAGASADDGDAVGKSRPANA